jgi:hypothetical protein
VRAILLSLVLFLPGVITFAQPQDVSTSVVTVDGHSMITISNSHRVPIEAFLLTVDIDGANHVTNIHYDIHSNYKHDVAILPGASHQVPLPHLVGKDLPVPTLRAVVFSDGTSLGEGLWVQELLHRRKILLDRMEEVMTLLQSMSDQGLSREQAHAALQKAWQAHREATSGATIEERVWNDQVFYMATRNLEGRPRSDGTVPEFSASLRHLQRSLGEWHDDLQSSKPGPPKASLLNSRSASE